MNNTVRVKVKDRINQDCWYATSLEREFEVVGKTVQGDYIVQRFESLRDWCIDKEDCIVIEPKEEKKTPSVTNLNRKFERLINRDSHGNKLMSDEEHFENAARGRDASGVNGGEGNEEEELWNEVGSITQGGVSFQYYPHILKQLTEKFSISRKSTANDSTTINTKSNQ